MKTLNLHEAATFLHMHPEELRTRAKRGIIPSAKNPAAGGLHRAKQGANETEQYQLADSVLP
jgi:hypothetical protein